MIAVGAALPVLALGLYLTYGSPRLPDQPLAARLEDPAAIGTSKRWSPASRRASEHIPKKARAGT